MSMLFQSMHCHHDGVDANVRFQICIVETIATRVLFLTVCAAGTK